ncbi:MAG: NHL repeat containing protein [Candidatus Magnetoglobus multicellularis str. Araruama]|uniref:NHL repeat containing protein n=1 Tax=Candidatus Magnetoglobus multicellularis str. Araruama TaxID=890399 RepID=A0A1V1NSG1_9BACT|nr:MAG: NHL repeat containing protein [Candidatus Magnetoglobus multicellularis str. Araruama]
MGQADFNSGTANRGGSVAANTFNGPNDLVVDSFGRLWVADYLNNRILRFDNASSIASGANADAVLGQTVFTTNSSGTTQNTFNQPTGIHIDPAGTLWVAEMTNHRVLRFDNAASKTNGANADGVLGQINFTSNTTGTTQNTMNGSFDVFGDHDDHIYVLDLNNNRVLRFDNASLKSYGANADAVLGQTDFVSSSNGTTQSNFDSPLAGTVDQSNHLYISDMTNNRVMIFNNPLIKGNGAPADYVLGQPNFTESTANNGGVSERSLNAPHWLFFDNINKYLWLPDATNYRVLRYTMLQKHHLL